jgi:protein-tyrosine phosphatase
MPVRRVDLTDYAIDLDQAIEDAARVLTAGRLVVMPTETVYGIAGKPDTATAGAQLAELRAGTDSPLAPHLGSPEELDRYVPDPTAVGRKLSKKLWPGPVALIFSVSEADRSKVASALSIEAGTIFDESGRITLRCPDDPICSMLLKRAGQPVVLTRSGLPKGSGTVPPSPESVESAGVELLLDAGPTRLERPSTVIRIDGESWEVVREGIYDRRTVEKALRTTVLFVCSGNTCRSPMAMALGRQAMAEGLGVSLEQVGDRGYDVVSAGTFAMPGMRATPAAAEAVASVGGGLNSHRSRPLDMAAIHQADLIITMGQTHREAVIAQLPSAAQKTILLDPDGDIEDPIGSDAAHYKTLAERMRQLVRDRLGETILRDL